MKCFFRFKKVDFLLCDLCGMELETVEHLFFSCTKVSAFWDEIFDLLISLNISATPFDVKDVIFGIICPKNTSILVNYIILEVKYFIYRCKLNKTSLSLRSLIDKFKKTYQTERFIARKKEKRNNKLDLLHNKWKPLLPLINNYSTRARSIYMRW